MEIQYITIISNKVGGKDVKYHFLFAAEVVIGLK